MCFTNTQDVSYKLCHTNTQDVSCKHARCVLQARKTSHTNTKCVSAKFISLVESLMIFQESLGHFIIVFVESLRTVMTYDLLWVIRGLTRDPHAVLCVSFGTASASWLKFLGCCICANDMCLPKLVLCKALQVRSRSLGGQFFTEMLTCWCQHQARRRRRWWLLSTKTTHIRRLKWFHRVVSGWRHASAELPFMVYQKVCEVGVTWAHSTGTCCCLARAIAMTSLIRSTEWIPQVCHCWTSGGFI